MTDMTDDPMQDDTVLASAYLDGEVTPDERARVEASPELLAEVDRLRQVRALIIADDEPAAISVREAHLAAALDVWDQLGGETSTPSGGLAAATPISAGRARRDRRRGAGEPNDRMKLLLGAAAGLIVLAGVGAVVRGVIVGTGDDDADFADEAPAEESADEAEIGPLESEITAELAGEPTNDELRIEIDASEVASDVDDSQAPAAAEASEEDAAMAEEPADAPAEEPAEEEAMEEEAADESADDAVSEAGDAPPDVDIVELATPQDLADFAAPAAYAPFTEDDVDLEAAFTPCGEERSDGGLGIDRLAELAIVEGEIVNVGIDLDDELVFAFRDDCSIVLDAILPTEDEFLASVGVTPSTTAAP